MKTPLRMLAGLGAVLVGLTCGACAAGHGGLRQRMESFDPAERIRAIRIAAQREDRSLVPALVDRLDDADPAVRMYAILALERITGTRRGYSYVAPSDRRRQAIDAWRRSIEQDAIASGEPAAPPGGPKVAIPANQSPLRGGDGSAQGEQEP